MSPPLMRHFMRADLVDKVRHVETEAKHVPNRAADEREIRQINERGPRLSGEPRRLLRDRDAFVGERSEKQIAGSRGVRAVRKCRLREARRVDANRSTR